MTMRYDPRSDWDHEITATTLTEPQSFGSFVKDLLLAAWADVRPDADGEAPNRAGRSPTTPGLASAST